MEQGTGGGKLNTLGNSFGIDFGGVYVVTTIVFAGTSDVPAVDGMRCPSETSGGALKYQDLFVWGCKLNAVEIKVTVQLGHSGEAWIDPGCPEKV